MKKAIFRLLRCAVSIAITGTVASITHDEEYIYLAPAINALAKYLRDKYGIKYLPV